MRKSTISGVWLSGLGGVVGGIIAIALGVILMLAYGGTYGGANGQEFTPALNGAFFWWTIALITVGGLAFVAGGIAQIVAWIGALVNTYGLADKAWFVVLLIAGLIGLVMIPLAGFVAMAVYVLVGPDAKAPVSARTTSGAPPVTLAPAS